MPRMLKGGKSLQTDLLYIGQEQHIHEVHEATRREQEGLSVSSCPSWMIRSYLVPWPADHRPVQVRERR